MSNALLATAVRTIRQSVADSEAAGRADAELLCAFATRRDESAFAELVRRYGPMVLGVCRRELRHEHDAEDAFQATFLVLARAAASVRRGEALAGWLHGVAYRVALKAKREAARRRAREGSVRPAEGAGPVGEAAWREVQAVLDEEVGRLPPIYRTAFVLCCLDGLSLAEAARRLGLKDGTLSSRLAAARKRLRQRLTQRGVTLSAALAALVPSAGGRAAVPPLLSAATVRASAGALAGPSANVLVNTLAEGATRTMITTKTRRTTVLLFAMLGLFGAASVSERSPHRSLTLAAPTTPDRKPAAPGEKKEDVLVTGRVLAPDGMPAASADVVLRTRDGPRTTAGPDGRFRLAVTIQQLQGGAPLVARAKGFAPDWLWLGQPPKGEVTLRLAKDVPLRGRVLDLEGQPVAGVRAQVLLLRKWADGDDLTPWFEKNRERLALGGGPDMDEGFRRIAPGPLGVIATATTGKDGRFRLDGFGGERIVSLRITGPGIEHCDTWVLTRDGPVRGLQPQRRTYFATFDHLAGPTKPFVGTVRDRKTGAPLAGARVECMSSGAETRTDAKGQYRLVGAPKRTRYFLNASDPSYFNVHKPAIPDTPGLDPIRVDFDLDRGIVVTGRLTDGEGRPVRGTVYYYPLPDNPHRKDFASLGTDLGEAGPDGIFTTLVIPGPGVLLVSAAEPGRFVRADLKPWKLLLSQGQPVSVIHAVAKINPAEGASKATCTVALETGRTVAGTAVGADGRPLAGVWVAGADAHGLNPWTVAAPRTSPDGTFAVATVDPRRPRTLVLYHPEKKVGKVHRLPAGEADPVRVRLAEPLGTLAGRVVDADGKPWPGLQVMVYLTRRLADHDDLPPELWSGPRPGADEWMRLKTSWRERTACRTTTDAEGRFRVEGLIAGLPYEMLAWEGGELRKGAAVTGAYHGTGLSAESGKVKDLGDLKSKVARPAR